MMRSLLMMLLVLGSSVVFGQNNDQFLPHELTREEKARANAEGYAFPTDRGIETPPDFPNIRTAAEWEEIQALTIAWQSYTGILKQIVHAAVNECEVIILSENVSSTQNFLLNNDWGGPVDLTNVTIINTDLNSIWMRDYGANTVYGNEVDDLFLVDWIYNRPRPDDDVSPEAVANYLGLDLYSTTGAPNDLMNTGGNYMSDGFGQAFCSELVLNENEGGNTGWGTTYPNHTEAEIDDIMNQFMGIDTYIKMTPLPFDGINHIDMHMKLINEETILVSEYPEGVADGPQIEANIQYIQDNFTTKYGTPYNIVRIPAPPQQSNGNYPDQNGWYCTYTNSVFVNNSILVPTYYEQYDTTALRIYEELLPGYNIVPIDCDNSGQAIISASGAIHCITQSVGVEDPLLISYECLPDTDDELNDYTLEAYINHRTGIANATLYYKTDLNDPYTSVAMTDQGNNNWSASIPAQPFGTTVYYYVEGVANSGKTQTRPMPAPAGYKEFRVINAVFGCTDPDACNYDASANIDDGSCELAGCTDVNACNYNPNAVCDNGSCAIGFINLAIDTDCWGNEVSWNVSDDNGNIVANDGNYPDQTTISEDICISNGCYTFNIFDSFGDGMNGTASGCNVNGNYQMTDTEGALLFEMGAADYGDGTSHEFCVEVAVDTPGCTDPTACNYDPFAVLDDGSCIYPDGCTDPAACNYFEFAQCDDGSCIMPDGCTDPTACNYDASAQCDDGSCDYLSCLGCTDPTACNYDAAATQDDGSCLTIYGCTDTNACNYDASAECDDSSCEYLSCLGCTDNTACNYDASATQEDGSCTYAVTYYLDNDMDGFGSSTSQDFCDDPGLGWSLNDSDCNDDNPAMYPFAPATAEGIDNDCSGMIEEDEEAPSPCLGDFDNDGIITTSDLLVLLGNYGCLENCVADLDGNDIVNTADMLVMLGIYGQTCE
ncbi:agmatine deiminase family protein [Sanyastnella coralliicola]|uniref:agmatine deiminase family protein n=1 Tax=Sanyastnella coralliicola TaxID=3069118 RepID=UPI0027B967E5|nr:agmatine deiminase family protein [Longitalea sp. SCSIO 12813]